MTCKICGAPHVSTPICFQCEDWLARLLFHIAAHAGDLEVSR